MDSSKTIVFLALVIIVGAAVLFLGNPSHHSSRSSGTAPMARLSESSANSDLIESLTHDLKSGSLDSRIRAAQELASDGNLSAVPQLIDSLSDRSAYRIGELSRSGEGAVRYWANIALKKISHLDFGFEWNAPESSRAEAIIKWRRWYREASEQAEIAAANAEKRTKRAVAREHDPLTALIAAQERALRH